MADMLAASWSACTRLAKDAAHAKCVLLAGAANWSACSRRCFWDILVWIKDSKLVFAKMCFLSKSSSYLIRFKLLDFHLYPQILLDFCCAGRELSINR
jgi:hypothetical protein